MSIDKKVFDSSNQTGFFIGPTLKFSLPLIGLGIDIAALYDQRSAKVSDAKENDGKETLKQQAINIPINLRYGIGLGSLTSIYFAAGPQFGFNVGDKDKKIFDEATWQLKKSTFSVNLGAGVSLIKYIEIGANYNIACGKTGEVTFTDGVKQAIKGRNSAYIVDLRCILFLINTLSYKAKRHPLPHHGKGAFTYRPYNIYLPSLLSNE